MTNTLYQPFSSMQFDHDHCFLCGEELSEENRSNEHIFPKWVQNKFDLWNQKLQLPNGTLISYKQLTIPCCKICNNVYLSEIENKVKEKSDSFESFSTLEPETIFKWVTKIFYGLIFKDLSLMIDRKQPDKGTIVTKELLERFKLVHEMLQSIRLKITFSADAFSLFIFRVHRDADNEIRRDFFFSDDVLHSQIAIQLGEIGIVCCIAENGITNKKLSKFIKPYLSYKLHPIQFSEMIARIFYMRSLLRVKPLFIFIRQAEGYNVDITVSSLFGNYFNDIVQTDLASYIWRHVHQYGVRPEQIYSPELDAVGSFLIDQHKKLIIVDASAKPIEGIKVEHPDFEGELFPPVN